MRRVKRRMEKMRGCFDIAGNGAEKKAGGIAPRAPRRAYSRDCGQRATLFDRGQWVCTLRELICSSRSNRSKPFKPLELLERFEPES
jgi:hypothetical protein